VLEYSSDDIETMDLKYPRILKLNIHSVAYSQRVI